MECESSNLTHSDQVQCYNITSALLTACNASSLLD